jgi:hypothetical protein
MKQPYHQRKNKPAQYQKSAKSYSVASFVSDSAIKLPGILD